MRRVLITGSDHGLGLKWARQLSGDNWRVFATCRHPGNARELNALAARHANLTVHQLDVTSVEDIRAAHWALMDQPLDLLLHNTGIDLEKGAPHVANIRHGDWLRTLEADALGAVRVTEALAEHLEMGTDPMVAVTGAHMGSITNAAAPGSDDYPSSRAVLNAAFTGIAAKLRPRGIPVIILQPGAVPTRMDGPEGSLSTERSEEAMRRVLDVGVEETGESFRYDSSREHWWVRHWKKRTMFPTFR